MTDSNINVSNDNVKYDKLLDKINKLEANINKIVESRDDSNNITTLVKNLKNKIIFFELYIMCCISMLPINNRVKWYLVCLIAIKMFYKGFIHSLHAPYVIISRFAEWLYKILCDTKLNNINKFNKCCQNLILMLQS